MTEPDARDGPAVSHRVVLVQCTGQKRDGTHRARDLYDESDYFCKQRAYAEAVADQWFIQSAKHGLLHPTDYVESYDKHARDIGDPGEWAERIAARVDSCVPRDAGIEILGGSAYADPIVPELEWRGYEVLEPIRGKMIGERKAWLIRAVDQSLEGYV